MADKHVVRQDVIQIDLDSNNLLSAFEKIQEDINKLKKSFGVMDKDIDTMKNSFGDMGKKSPFGKVKSEADKAAKSTKQTNSEAKELKTTLGDIAKTNFNKVTTGMKKIGTAAAKATVKATAVGMGAAAAGVAAMVRAAVKGFGDYEQLTGGVETLFKDSSNIVQRYANDAYKTAGLSANNYMETVTGFSASLLQSLDGDTKKAAEIANKAITDMSDNANKMGTDMESIKTAYQGFAKQNYTMLDNLKLGYGGTKEEMQRLLKDASKMANKTFDISSYADIIEAIHVIQDSIGITGTTAKEASTTIQGSWASVKSSWGNLMTSLVTGGDSFDQCIDNFIGSAKTFGNNIMPAIRAGVEGAGYMIQEMAPVIEAELPGIVNDLLPPLISAATMLFRSFIKALPGIAKVIIKELPNVVSQIGQAIAETFGDSFIGKAGSIFADNAGAFAKIIPLMIGGIFMFKQFSGIFNTLSGLTKGVGKGAEEMTKNSNGIFGSIGKTDTKTILKGMGNIAIIIGGFTAIAAALMFVAPYISRLSDVKSIMKLAAVITVLGVVGTALTFFASIVGKVPLGTTVKGLSNMAIMLLGMTGVYTAIAWIDSKFNADNKRILAIAGTLGVLGLLGGAMSVFAGIVGLIPIPMVLTGLANIALVLGGLTLVVAAFGEISKIPHINEFITTGGDLIALLFEQIGKIAGALIGGLGEGITNTLPKIGDNLTKFAESIQPMFTTLSGADIKGIGSFFKDLGAFLIEMTGNKIASFFTGGTNLEGLGKQLTSFAENAKGFIQNADSITNSATAISTFGATTKGFFEQVNSLNLGNLKGLWNVLKDMGKTSTENISKMVDDSINNIVKKAEELPKKMGEAITNSGDSLKTAVVKIWKDAVTASAAPVNKLLDGANFILKEFGSATRVAKWMPYAKGTEGHKGGNALVNDGRGAEMVQMPNGNTFIPKGRNVLIPNAPKGMKVLSAEDTAKLMGRNTPTYRYADGNIDIWSFLDDAKGLVNAIKNEYVNYESIKGIALHFGKGLVSKISEAMTPWTKKLMDEFGVLGLENYNPSKGVDQWKTTVIRALKMEGQYSEANLRRTLYQMQTESGGNPMAINLWDSNAAKGIPSKGLMQVIDPTFRAYAREGFNKNIYDPLSNILASIRYAVSRYGSLASAYRGVGYANGGIAAKPSIFGENGPEMAIPLTLNKRARALSLWRDTGDILGAYTPEDSPAKGRSQSYGYDNYNFNINITVDGNGSETTIASRVKQAVKDGIKEMMDSFASDNKPVREY